MKSLLRYGIAVLAFTVAAFAQIGIFGGVQGGMNATHSGVGAPASSLGIDGDLYIDTTPGAPKLYGPKTNGQWPTAIALGGSGSGSAACTPATASVTGCVIIPANSGLAVDANGKLSVSLNASFLPAFSGDMSTTAGSSVTTLATVNSTPGTFGDVAHSAAVTVDGKGRITGISQVAINSGLADPGSNGVVVRTGVNTTSSVAAPVGTIVGTTDTQTLTNKSINASEINSGTVASTIMPAFSGDVSTAAGTTATTLATVNSSPGAYGDSAHSLSATVDAKGRITALSSNALAVSGLAPGSLLTTSNGTIMADRSDPALATFNTAVHNMYSQGSGQFLVCTSANCANSPQHVDAVLVGDSWTQGADFKAYTNTWAQQVTQALQSAYGYHGTGIIPMYTSSGAWTFTGTWTQINALGPAQGGASAFNMLYVGTGTANTAAMGSATGTLIKYFGDHLVVYYATYTDSGAAFGVSIDGGATTACGATTSASYTPATCSVATSAGWHTAVITPPATGNCYLYGAEWTYGSNGISVHNLGRGSARSEAFGSSAATQLVWAKQLSAAPKLVVISLGINDFGGNVTPGLATAPVAGTYAYNLQQIISFFQTNFTPAPSILILDQGMTNQTGTYPRSQYQAIEQQLAIANNCTYLSVAERWGSYANANALGLMYTDGIHPVDFGYVDIAQMILRRILENPTPPLLTTGGNVNVGSYHYSGFENGSTYIGVNSGGSGYFFSTGSNTEIGNGSGQANQTGHNNSCFGQYACGTGPATGSNDVGMGSNAQFGSSTGSAGQIGAGTNQDNSTLQFQNWNFLDNAGFGNFKVVKLAEGSISTSASTASPVYGITHMTGSITVTTLVPPSTISGTHNTGQSGTFTGCVKIIADNGFSTATGGNIAAAYTLAAGKMYDACFDGTSWYFQGSGI